LQVTAVRAKHVEDARDQLVHVAVAPPACSRPDPGRGLAKDRWSHGDAGALIAAVWTREALGM